MAMDAGTTLAGMTMALTYERAPGEYTTETASGIGTSQEGEALTPLPYIRQLEVQQGTY